MDKKNVFFSRFVFFFDLSSAYHQVEIQSNFEFFQIVNSSELITNLKELAVVDIHFARNLEPTLKKSVYV
jgi:hypothetical protein